VKGYSSIFRLLYNSSFLDTENSEKLLATLSESSFNQGLRQGVPENIKISHKFGEREITKTGEKQLHDCGIIYYPTNPYLLCVMTKGKDFKELTRIIGHISSEVYKEFDSRKIK
jgi:beta-lactamase class A